MEVEAEDCSFAGKDGPVCTIGEGDHYGMVVCGERVANVFVGVVQGF